MSSRLLFPIAGFAAVALAACSGAGDDVLPNGTLPLPLVAHGNQPFWWLRLDDETVAFGTLGDVATFTADERLGLERSADGSIVVRARQGGRSLEARLEPCVATDSMTSMPHPYAVTVQIDDREWRGVGGDPGGLLRGLPWVVLQAGEQSFAAGQRPKLEFRRDDALVIASAAGVTIGGWSVGGESLRLSGLDALSSPLREALAGVRTFSISAGGELVLEGDGGVALRAIRQRP